MKTQKTEALIQKAGGFIAGVCEPCGMVNGELLLGANLRWIRSNSPYPFDKDGNLRNAYIAYKELCRKYEDMGIHTMSITPYPRDFLEWGIDFREVGGAEKVREVCEFLARDLKDCVNLWQASNEMMYIYFSSPLNDVESRDFLIQSILGLKAGNPDAIIGHNSVCPSSDGEVMRARWLTHCRNIEAAVGGYDYIGFDYYAGTWSPGSVEAYSDEINYVAEKLGIPVILVEFGFASIGEVTDDIDAEMITYLNSIGFVDYQDLDRRIDDIAPFLSPRMRDVFERGDFQKKHDWIHSNKCHFTKKFLRTSDIPHTEEGQAEFFKGVMNLLLANENTAGTFIFNFADGHACWMCGAPDCPCEGHWGLVRADGTPKPAYGEIREALQSV